MFHTLKCGTENEDTEILNFNSKILPFGAWLDDGVGDEIHGSCRWDSQKRKRISDEMVQDRNNRTKHIAELFYTLKTLVYGRPTSSRNQAASGSNSAELINEFYALTKKLSDLTKLSDGNSLIQQSIRVTVLELGNARSKCANLLAESS